MVKDQELICFVHMLFVLKGMGLIHKDLGLEVFWLFHPQTGILSDYAAKNVIFYGGESCDFQPRGGSLSFAF